MSDSEFQMPDWKYAFIPYYSNTPHEAIEVLSRYGYQGVEWIAYLHFNTRDELKNLAELTRKAVWKLQISCARPTS